MMRWLSLSVLWATILAMILLGVSVTMAACPPDRPQERMVTTTMQTCTLLACLGPLICPDDETKNCYRGVAMNCNTCTPIIESICLSDTEMTAAKQRK